MQFTRKQLIIGLVVLLVLCIVALVACSPGGGEQSTKKTKGDITLTYWRLFDDKDAFQPIIDEYQKEHSNVKIEYKKLDPKDYEKQLLEAFASGRAPDLFSIHDDWLPRYQANLAPLPEKSYKTEDFQRDYYKLVSQEMVRDNRIYGIPYSIDTLALFTNNQLLGQADIDEAPKHWEDLTGVANDPAKPGMLAKLNNRQGATFNQAAIALGSPKINRAADILALIMLQQRTTMVNEQRDRAIFHQTQNVSGQEIHLGTEALKFYTSFADPTTSHYSWSDDLGDSVRAFATGKVAMMIGYPYHIPQIERINENLEYSISPVPQIGETDPVNFAGFWTEVVSNKSANQEEAWDFIRFASDRNQVKVFNDATKRVPARKEVRASGTLTVFAEQSETALSWYKGDNRIADEAFVTMISQVLAGSPHQNAIDTAATRVTEALGKVANPSQ